MSFVRGRRLESGVAGLDAVLGGGFLIGGSYLLAGGPGTGKTVVANQVCFFQARRGESCVYITVLAESHSRMIANLESMSFFEPALLDARIAYMSGAHVLRENGLDGLFGLIHDELRRREPVLLVLDGLTMGAKVSGESESDLSRFFNRLGALLEYCNCTAIVCVLSEPGLTAPAYALADGLLELGQRRAGRAAVRELVVRKLRGSLGLAGVHPLGITENGVEVYPRIEARAGARSVSQSAAAGRCSFGIEKLDEMLLGGVPEGSVTALLGTSGVGKTLLGLHFLAHAAESGRPALYFGCLESPERLVDAGEGIGLPLRRLTAANALTVVWQKPFENLFDAVVARLLEHAGESGARQVYIDGIDLLMRSDGSSGDVENVLAATIGELRALGATTLLSFESHLPRANSGPDIDYIGSPLVDNALVLRYMQRDARLRRTLWIAKVRGSGFDSTIRELRVTSSGIRIGAELESEEEQSGPSGLGIEQDRTT